MRELFASLERVPLRAGLDRPLLDTCFLLDLAERRQLHTLLHAPVATTSFNLEELEHVSRRMHDKTKEELRHFFKTHPDLVIVDVPVHPGDRAAERSFVAEVDPDLLLKVPDASDAVLVAAAIRCRCDVFTKDKHHLFTVQLENYLHAYDLRVFKEWKDMTG